MMDPNLRVVFQLIISRYDGLHIDNNSRGSDVYVWHMSRSTHDMLCVE